MTPRSIRIALFGFLVIKIMTTGFACAQNGQWVGLPAMATPREAPEVAAGPDGRIYAMGGFDFLTFSLVNSVEAFDPITNSWSFVAPMPFANGGGSAATGQDGRIYVIGGVDALGDRLNTVMIYDPGFNTWVLGKPMPTPRGGLATAVGKDGKIYAIGGSTFDSSVPCCSVILYNTVEIYDPKNDSWAVGSAMPTARQELAAVAGPDGRIYAFGGFDPLTFSDLTTVEIYDPTSNSWSAGTPMLTARSELSAVTRPGGRIFVIGGEGPGRGGVPGDESNPGLNANRIVDAYDPTKDAWSSLDPLPAPVNGLVTAGTPDGRIYAVSGNVSPFNAAEVYLAPNGIDISRSAASLGIDSPVWEQLRLADIQFVVVQARGSASENPFAACQLLGAQKKALKTGAYVLLNFNDPNTSATDQVQSAFHAVSQSPNCQGSALKDLRFMVVDVEPLDGQIYDQDNNSIQQRVEFISEAVAAVRNAGKDPVIYTDRDSWANVLTGNSFAFTSLPLWDTVSHTKRPAANNSFSCGDGLAKLERDCTTDVTMSPGNSCIPNQEHRFEPYPPGSLAEIGWLTRQGKQYDLGIIIPGDSCNGDGTSPLGASIDLGIPIDLDVFDPELFSESSSSNTPIGNNVVLLPTPTGITSLPVTVIFQTVEQAGKTALSTLEIGPPPPSGFGLGSPPLYFDLTTTALFSGTVQVCVNYASATFSNPNAVKLFHFESGTWIDRTTSLNSANKTICAAVTSFSPFAAFESVDTIPPVTIATISPPPNSNGWNNSDVSVLLSSTDNEAGGTGVKQLIFSASGGQPISTTMVSEASASITVNTEGVTILTFFAVDRAGNVESAHTLTIRLDKTPPTVFASRTPLPNAAGWNNTNVTVSFVCSDNLSGLAPGSPPAATIVATEGVNRQVTGTCQDLAGNTASATVSGIEIDKTPPVLVGLPAPGCTLWPPDHRFATIATISGIDALSGLVSLSVTGASNEPMNADDPDILITGTGIQPRIVQLRAERLGSGTGRIYTVTTTAIDQAGNAVTAARTCAVPHDQRP